MCVLSHLLVTDKMFVKKQEYVYKKRNFEGGFNIKGQGQTLKDTAPSP